MRVTDGMMFDQAIRENGRALEQLQRATDRTASGLRVEHPGDDPAAAGLIVSAASAQNRFDAIATTTQRASGELSAADGALNTVSNVLAQAQQLAVQMANSTYSTSQRTAAAAQADALLKQAIASLNSSVDGRYLFGGTLDASPPFDTGGNYLGDTAVRQVEIAPGTLGTASIRADVAVKGVGGGADALTTLQQLSAALAADDPAAVQSLLDPLSRSIDQVAAARSQAGTAMRALDVATSVSQTARDERKKGVSQLAEADVVESATRLAQTQQALEASLTATAKGFQLSLLDFLK
jgi:flagellar hook-associated protein 3 FlgL